jgi:hypothetical protein
MNVHIAVDILIAEDMLPWSVLQRDRDLSLSPLSLPRQFIRRFLVRFELQAKFTVVGPIKDFPFTS